MHVWSFANSCLSPENGQAIGREAAARAFVFGNDQRCGAMPTPDGAARDSLIWTKIAVKAQSWKDSNV